MTTDADIRAQALNEAATICDERAARLDAFAKDCQEMADSDRAIGLAGLAAEEQKLMVMDLARKIRALVRKPAA